MGNLALHFVRWGTGLLILGLANGYGPLGHYLMGGAISSCPVVPVHGHTILLGWVGISGVFLTIYGLGCLLFLWVVPRSTGYKIDGDGPAVPRLDPVA